MRCLSQHTNYLYWTRSKLTPGGLILLLLSGVMSGCSQISQIHEAVKKGDLATLQLLVGKERDSRKAINEQDKEGYAALHWAVAEGKIEIVRWLLKSGADPTLRTRQHETALLLAGHHGRPKIAVHLIDAGADVKEMNKQGHTAVTLAAKNGHHEVIKMLLERGADLGTAVSVAAENGHIEVIKILLRRGADVNGLRDFHAEEHGMTGLYMEPMPLTVAAKNGHREVVKYLIGKGSQTSSTFADVVQRVDEPMMEYLLGMGVRPDAQVLISAIRRHEPKLILRLLRLARRGDYINSMSSLGGGRYCNLPPVEIVELLVDYNQEAAKEAPTLLHAAVCHDTDHETNVTQLFLSRGIPVNAQDEYGNTPLHWAAEKGNINRTRLLLEHGAEVSARSEWGNTPLHRAVPGRHANVVKLLLDHGAKIDAVNEAGTTPLHMAALRGDASIMRHFIERGAKLHVKNRLGHAPIHAAAAGGWPDAVRLLVENGASVRTTGEDGMVPLHYVLSGMYNHFHSGSHFPTNEFSVGGSAERLEVIRILIDKGADVSARTKNSIAPLHYAVAGSNPRNEKYDGPFGNGSEQAAAIKLLLAAGADPHASDNAKPPSTALDIARTLKLNTEVVGMLESAARKASSGPRSPVEAQQSSQRP